MKRLDVLNLLALALALLAGAFGGQLGTGRGARTVAYYPRLESDVKPTTQADGTRVLIDAGGRPVPLRRYERILSGSLIADRVLADLCEPTRIVGFTPFAGGGSPWQHRYVGKPKLHARGPVEKVLELNPDLVFVNNVVDPGRVARLREQGIRTFDLGHMRGLDSLLANIRAIGWMIGAPERAEAYAVALDRRMDRVAPEPGERPRALYLAIIADRMFGGARNTSYHDVLEHAGLRDAADEAGLDGWPELTPEQVLSLDPDYIVTRNGMGKVLCDRATLRTLRACQLDDHVLEVDGLLLDDPGPAMLETTEILHEVLQKARRRHNP